MKNSVETKNKRYEATNALIFSVQLIELSFWIYLNVTKYKNHRSMWEDLK